MEWNTETQRLGAYRIRPEDIRVDKWTHSGVCDTPLHEMFADIQIKESAKICVNLRF